MRSVLRLLLATAHTQKSNWRYSLDRQKNCLQFQVLELQTQTSAVFTN